MYDGYTIFTPSGFFGMGYVLIVIIMSPLQGFSNLARKFAIIVSPFQGFLDKDMFRLL
jgi:hypothetical protein